MAIVHEKVDHEPKLEFSGPFGPGPRETVADLIRRARKDIGQDLRGVADVLRIRLGYLEAIESGDFDRLPGTTYAIGFLRTYAEYLGLDGEEMVERFKAETQAAERRSELIFPEPVAEGRIPGGAIIFVSVILLALAYVGWFYMSQQGRSIADLIPTWPTQAPTQTATTPNSEPAPVAATPAGSESTTPVSAAPMEPAPETAAPEAAAPEADVPEAAAPEADVPEADVPEAASIVATSAAQASPTGTAANVGAAPMATPAVAESVAPMPTATPAMAANTTAQPAPPAAESPAPGQDMANMASQIDQTVVIPAPPTTSETVVIPDDRSPRVYGGSNDESRIVIRALQDSWVQVRDPQEAILLTRVLRAGDSYHVPNVEGLTLLTGNAGGIELEVDGVRLPPAGPPGSVRRSIALDPAQLLSAAAANR